MSDRGHEPSTADREGKSLNFGPRRFVSALALMLVLAIVGAGVGIVSRGGSLDLSVWNPVAPRWLILAFVVAVADILLGGWRLYVLAHRIEPKVRFLDCVRANLGNYCLAGLTPSQAGGGAAQLYILARAGLPWSAGVAIATINFLASILVLCLAGLFAVFAFSGALPEWLRWSTTGTVALFGILVVALGALLRWGSFAPDSESLQKAGRVKRWILTAGRFLHDSLEIARGLFKRHPRRTAWTFPLTTGIYTSKLVFTYCVFQAFGPQGAFSDMVGALIVMVLALYFAPTPGASGLAEGATTAYLAGSLGTSAAAGFALWWRALAVYGPVVTGGLVILAQLAKEGKPRGD